MLPDDLAGALRRKARQQPPSASSFFSSPVSVPFSPFPFPAVPPVVQTLRAQPPQQSALPDNYSVFVNDETVVNPFGISNRLVQIIQRETRGLATQESKARRIFDWMQSNIRYDEDFRNDRSLRSYASSLETLRRGEGVCGEQAFLYISMARSVGITSSYVVVTRDYKHKSVNHACACVTVERGKIHVDPAYHRYDIKHCKERHLKDREVIDNFRQWRSR